MFVSFVFYISYLPKLHSTWLHKEIQIDVCNDITVTIYGI